MKNLIIAFCFMLIGECEGNQWSSLRIKNASDNPISFYQASSVSQRLYPYDVVSDFLYPDTTISKKNITLDIGVTRYSLDNQGKWEDVVSKLPSDTLSIFIFDTATIENNSWDEVRENYLVLKRYDLSLEDLQLLDFTVPYPPTPEMANMRQYPPYGE